MQGKQRSSLAFPEVRSISLWDSFVVGEVSNEQECNGMLRRLLTRNERTKGNGVAHHEQRGFINRQRKWVDSWVYALFRFCIIHRKEGHRVVRLSCRESQRWHNSGPFKRNVMEISISLHAALTSPS